MTCPKQITTLALYLLCGLPTLAAAAESFTGQVVAVTDGDTIKVMHEGLAEKVRLNGIDCPEKRQPFGIIVNSASG